MSESFTTKQVAEHNTVDNGLYIIIDSNVYKMDTFVDEHPGGAKILKRVGGKDASKQFWKVCRYSLKHFVACKADLGVEDEAGLLGGRLVCWFVLIFTNDVECNSITTRACSRNTDRS